MQYLVPRRPGRGLARGIPAVLSVVSAFLIWEIYVRVSGISPLMLPAPSRVLDQIVQNRALLWDNTVPTLKATFAGFAWLCCTNRVKRVLPLTPDGFSLRAQ